MISLLRATVSRLTKENLDPEVVYSIFREEICKRLILDPFSVLNYDKLLLGMKRAAPQFVALAKPGDHSIDFLEGLLRDAIARASQLN